VKVAASKPCASCPFRLEADTCFRPKVLDATVGENLRNGRAMHRCHGAPTLICAGTLAYLKTRGELYLNQEWRILTRLRAISEDDIDTTVPIAPTWNAVLATHRKRMRDSVRIEEDPK
jgi:hypothetical protein